MHSHPRPRARANAHLPTHITIRILALVPADRIQSRARPEPRRRPRPRRARGHCQSCRCQSYFKTITRPAALVPRRSVAGARLPCAVCGGAALGPEFGRITSGPRTYRCYHPDFRTGCIVHGCTIVFTLSSAVGIPQTSSISPCCVFCVCFVRFKFAIAETVFLRQKLTNESK